MKNINGTNDPFYRYKMPCLSIKYNKKGTQLENIKDIGTALERKVEYLLLYISKRIGSHVITSEGNYFLKGKHELKEINKALTDFIQKYVLCAVCSNPETIFDYKNEKIKSCKSCGVRHNTSTIQPKLNTLEYIDNCLFDKEQHAIQKILSVERTCEDILSLVGELNKSLLIRCLLPKLLIDNIWPKVVYYHDLINYLTSDSDSLQLLFWHTFLYICTPHEELYPKMLGMSQYLYEHDDITEDTLTLWYKTENKFITKEKNDEWKKILLPLYNAINTPSDDDVNTNNTEVKKSHNVENINSKSEMERDLEIDDL